MEEKETQEGAEDIYELDGSEEVYDPDKVYKIHEPDNFVESKPSLPDSVEKSKGDNAAEKILTVIAYFSLIGGILSTILYAMAVESEYYYEENTLEIFLIIILGTVSSVFVWAIIMVTVNMSNNIRQIKHELRAMRKRKYKVKRGSM